MTSSETSQPPPAAPPVDDEEAPLFQTVGGRVLWIESTPTHPLLPLRSLRSRVDAYVANASSRRPPAKLTFEICIAINKYLAETSDTNMSARIPEIGPVTYVFLGRINARLLLARFTDYFNISTLVAPLTYSAYASAPSVLQPLVDTTEP